MNAALSLGAASAIYAIDGAGKFTIEQLAIAQISRDLTSAGFAGAPADCLQFFRALFATPRAVLSSKCLAAQLGIHYSTLLSRFFRAGLPSPKTYLDRALLIRLAGARADRPFRQVVLEFDFSSPSAANRTVKRLTGMPGATWFNAADPDREFARFRGDLVLPYLDQLRNFNPIGEAADR